MLFDYKHLQFKASIMRIFFFCSFAVFIQINSQQVEVKLKGGIVFGAREVTVFDQKSYYAFYGVPYAKVPVGRLRFQDPKPLSKWRKAFDASIEYHGACAQAHIVHKHALYGSEDCLYLNIYTPFLPNYQNQNENFKSVIVWIHGYAFTSSFSHVYGSDFLIENDILFISLTYRIGVFGFLKANDTDSSVNMGLKDIVVALKWIRRNIKSFGGNKKSITLMCSGSACTFASLLLLTDFRKLIQKLIIHSGTLFSPSIYQGFSKLNRGKLQEKITRAGYKDPMSAPTHAIVAASRKIYCNKHIINFQRPLVPFSPIIENLSENSLMSSSDVLDNIVSAAEDYNLPVIIGYTSQESMSEVIPFIHNSSYLKSLSSSFKFMVPFSDGCNYNYTSNVYNSIAGKIKKHYFKSHSDITIKDFLKYMSDIHKYPIFKYLNYLLKLYRSKMFVYKFNYDGKFNLIKSTSLAGADTPVKGAAHGDELCYILKCEPAWESYVKIKDDFNNRDRTFIKQIATMWANFAKFSDPTPTNQNSNIAWLPMTPKEDNIFLFAKQSKLIDSSKERRMIEFWDNIYSDYYSPKNCKNVHDEL